MRTVAILPVKRFDLAKRRLAGEDRPALARTMVGGVLAALAGARLEAVLVVTADPGAAALARGHGFQVVPEPSPAGHNAAAALGTARAGALGADRVLLVAGDCPLVTAADLDGLLTRHGGPGVVVVPDRHGTGTNALLLAPPNAIAPAFGPESRARHQALAAAAGLPCALDEVPALLLDVDTVDDLAAVERARARAR